MRLLMFVALLASCEGRCSPSDAVHDEVPAGVCAVDREWAMCLSKDTLYVCSIRGAFFNVASCSVAGRVHHGPEAP